MLKTKETKIIFKNQYLELQNNIVIDINTNKEFEHIKIIENEAVKPGAVVLCQYNDKFLLIENYRYGIDSLSLELPRGYIEKTETLENCAIRELYEETNILFKKNVDKIIKLGEVAINSSFIASKVPIYLIIVNQNIKNIKLKTEEQIQSYEWYKMDQISNDILNGKIFDTFTINAMMFYNLYYKVF